MKFDTFLASVGDWGKFQKMKYTLICLTYMLPPIMVYTYTFTAAVPNFRCRNPEMISNDSYNVQNNNVFNVTYKPSEAQCNINQKHLSLKECQRCYIQSNQNGLNDKLEKCNQYVFEKVHYEKTLVEEVKLHSKNFSTKSFIQFFSGIQFVIGLLIVQLFK
jgi:OCT family organic cation transporter-like MFS transporter 4/5